MLFKSCFFKNTSTHIQQFELDIWETILKLVATMHYMGPGGNMKVGHRHELKSVQCSY